MVLSLGLTTQEIRVLQEFRRLGKSVLTTGEIQAIKHPVRSPENPESSLLRKGYLATDQGDSFTVTSLASPLLSYNPVPENEVVPSTTDSSESAAEAE